VSLRLLVPTCLLAVLLGAAPARAQFGTEAERFLQAGAAVGPGLGVQAGLALPALTVLTREAVLYADYRLGGSEEQRLLVGLGLGGSLRVLRVLVIVADVTPGPFDVDVGLRLGPSFAFSFVEETAATQARQFRLFGDTYVRGSVALRGGRILYAELGSQPGRLRSGILLAL
jgi:hypothetical protein